MFKRIGWSFIGFMCLLDCISMLIHKNVKIGEKFFNFMMPAICIFCQLLVFYFWAYIAFGWLLEKSHQSCKG